MPFGMWTRVSPRNHVLDGVQIPTREGVILRRKGAGPGHAQTSPEVDILKAIRMGQHRYGADVDWSVLDGMHISDA